MYYLLPIRTILIVGLLVLAAGLVLRLYFSMDNALSGFLVGAGFTATAISLYRMLTRARKQ